MKVRSIRSKVLIAITGITLLTAAAMAFVFYGRSSRMIEENYPQHGIYGEELGIKEAFGPFPRYRWILDPIDGTRAFISNSFHFGNLIALERDEGNGFGPILSSIAFPAAGIRAVGWQGGAVLHRNALGITSENP